MSVLMVVRNLNFLFFISNLFYYSIFNCYLLSAIDLEKKALKDSNYVEANSGQLGIYGYAINKYNNFEFKGTRPENDTFIHYKPNGSLNLGIGISYKWLGLGLAYKFYFINKDDDLKGETRSLDLQLNIFTYRLLLEGKLQIYKGFYWSNPSAYISNWNEKDSLLVRPDIISVVLDHSGIYTLNYDKLSLRAAYQFTERQKKSAGSILLGYNISIYGVSADSSLIPHYLNNQNLKLFDACNINSISLGISLGYAYTLIIRKFYFISGFLMLGGNSQSFTIYDKDKHELENDFVITSNIKFRFSVGFNRANTFYGMVYYSDTFLIEGKKNVKYNYQYGHFRLYYGRRFDIRWK